MRLKNVMESLVMEQLDNMLKEMKSVCACQRCRDDMVAYALNNLKPLYATTERGETISKASALEPQVHTDLITAITKAIELVGKNPRHGEN